MVPTRRRLLAAGTGALALLAGCLENDSDPAEQDDGPEPGSDHGSEDGHEQRGALSDPLERVLGAIPQSVEGDSLEAVWIVRRPSEGSDEDPDPAGMPTTSVVAEQLGVPSETIDRAAVATDPENAERSLAVAAGALEADDIDRPDDAAIHVDDGLVVIAEDDGPWEAGIAAAQDTLEDDAAGLASRLAPVVAPVQTSSFIAVSGVTEEFLAETDEVPESVGRLAIARELVDERSQRIQFVVRFADAEAASQGTVETVIDAQGTDTDDLDVEYETVGPDQRTVVATFVTELPPSQRPDDSPDARFVYRDRAGVLEQIGDEAVDPDRLELRVDGDVRMPPWADREDPIGPETRFEVDLDPFRLVEVVWLDPDRDGVEQPLGRFVTADPDAFDGEYNHDSETLTITYTGDVDVDATNFDLRRGGLRDEPASKLTAFVGERLTPDESIVVEDVEYDDQIAIVLSVERSQGSEAFGITRPVFTYVAQPPGAFEFTTDDETVTITYRGSEPVPAEQYRIDVTTREGPVSTQFADQYDRLTEGDAVTVDAVAGDHVVVEWVDGDRSVSVDAITLTPDAEFEITYDATTDELTITHAGGDPIDPAQLRVEADTAVASTPWVEEYDTVEPGDTVVLTVEEAPDRVFVIFADQTALADREF